MRPTCSSCNRPLRVCLCAELPPRPICTATKVVILQHPHETRHKLATVPIIGRCLSNCDVIVGRRFQVGTSKLLDSFACSTSSTDSWPRPSSSADNGSLGRDESRWQCQSCGQRKAALLLFPSSDATELRASLSFRESHRGCRSLQMTGQPDSSKEGEANLSMEKFEAETQETSSAQSTNRQLSCSGVCSDGEPGHFILLVVDGTWQHAREMVKASMPFLEGFVEQVCLPHDMTREGWGMGDSNSIIRKEPYAGFVSTMEAVARSLAILEPDGVHIEQTLLSVLQKMVGLQATHFSPMKPRRRLRKPVNYSSQLVDG